MRDCILTMIWVSLILSIGLWGVAQSFSFKIKRAWIALGVIIIVSIIFGFLIFYS